jgi:thymidylate synthase (FAD)
MIKIQPYTTKNPISMIGEEAGICYGVNTDDEIKNYQRGLDCLQSGHGRTFEFPDVYLTISGYSARVMREWYTHIGGMPTRLQASTRYINYQNGFKYVIPETINKNPDALQTYEKTMSDIVKGLKHLEEIGIPKEDSAMLLPLGMETKVVCKHNLRNLIDMSHQRMCQRAYREYRELFNELCETLSAYSEEWKYIVSNYFVPKCEITGFCVEKKSCHRKPKIA